jgi:hypothetical protein
MGFSFVRFGDKAVERHQPFTRDRCSIVQVPHRKAIGPKVLDKPWTSRAQLRASRIVAARWR